MEIDEKTFIEMEQKLRAEIYQQQLNRQIEGMQNVPTMSSSSQLNGYYSAYPVNLPIRTNLPNFIPKVVEFYCEYCLNEKSSGCGCGAKKWKIK
jgi:hypothetical protein